MDQVDRRVVLGVAGLAGITALSKLAQGGPLNPPPGPIVPTPGPDPRTPISDTTTPGDATALFRITRQGSYYLTRDVIGEQGKHGIAIVTSSAVTIDLNGFRLTGRYTSGATGIANPSFTSVTVVNGFVDGWGGNGIEATTVDRVVVSGVQGHGIVGGFGARVTNSSISVSGGKNSDGIRVYGGAYIADCVLNVSYSDGCGISAGFLSQVHRCAVHGFALAAGCGIRVDSDGVISDCFLTMYESSSQQEAIFAGPRVDVLGCSLQNVAQFGIVSQGTARIADNTINGISAADSVGIQLRDSRSRIDGNHVTGLDVGIRVVEPGNTIIRNTAAANTTHYDIAPGNDVGPIGAAATSSSPWANLQS